MKNGKNSAGRTARKTPRGMRRGVKITNNIEEAVKLREEIIKKLSELREEEISMLNEKAKEILNETETKNDKEL